MFFESKQLVEGNVVGVFYRHINEEVQKFPEKADRLDDGYNQENQLPGIKLKLPTLKKQQIFWNWWVSS